MTYLFYFTTASSYQKSTGILINNFNIEQYFFNKLTMLLVSRTFNRQSYSCRIFNIIKNTMCK